MFDSLLLDSILLVLEVIHFSVVVVTLDLESFLGHLELIFVLSSRFSGKLELVIELIPSLADEFELMSSILFVLDHVILLEVVQVDLILLESVLFFVELSSSSLDIVIDFIFVILNSFFHLLIELLLMKLILSSGFSHLVKSILMGFLKLLLLEKQVLKSNALLLLCFKSKS